MKSNDFLKLLKERHTSRYYKDKPLSRMKIRAVLEAGRWSPSVHNIQPWRFIVLEKKSLIKKISNILIKKSKNLYSGFNIIVRETANILARAPVVVIVYNSCELSNRTKKFREPYFYITAISELESVSASIENILLMAQVLGIGCAWLTSPIFCESEIKSILKIKGSLVALLTLGYCSKIEYLTNRRLIKDMVRFC